MKMTCRMGFPIRREFSVSEGAWTITFGRGMEGEIKDEARENQKTEGLWWNVRKRRQIDH